MSIIRNNLNQPQMIGGKSLPAGGVLTNIVVDDDLRRLDRAGLISIVESQPEPETIQAEAPTPFVAEPVITASETTDTQETKK